MRRDNIKLSWPTVIRRALRKQVMPFQCLLAVSLLFSFTSCSRARIAPETKPTDTSFRTTIENRKYNLALLCHGEEIDTGTGEKIKVIRYVTLRDNATGEELKYTPLDEASLSSRAYATNAWSPDEEYLILPRGSFKGFCIINSGVALESVRKQQCSDFVTMQGANGTGLWHDFERWSDGHTFLFTAGLSGDDFPFEYNVQEQKLTALPPAARSFIAKNSKGKLDIQYR